VHVPPRNRRTSVHRLDADVRRREALKTVDRLIAIKPDFNVYSHWGAGKDPKRCCRWPPDVSDNYRLLLESARAGESAEVMAQKLRAYNDAKGLKHHPRLRFELVIGGHMAISRRRT